MNFLSVLTLTILGLLCHVKSGYSECEQGESNPSGPPGELDIDVEKLILSGAFVDVLDKFKGSENVAEVLSEHFGKTFTEDETKNLLTKTLNVLQSTAKLLNIPKTCAGLNNNQRPSGVYKIDPNGGGANDAIEVWCDMESGSTCVEPVQLKWGESNNATEEAWLSDIEKKNIEYKANPSQIEHLQLLSTEAYQNITYNCKNSVAYEDLNGEYEQSLRLLTWNDSRLSAKGFLPFMYKSDLDKCKSRKPFWKKTVVYYNTDRPMRLPIVDVYVSDIGRGSDFTIEFGPVCFK